MNQLPILLCIDVEPDERSCSPTERADWKGFEASYRVFSQFRERLEAMTQSPVHFSWFLGMYPQIAGSYGSASWVVDRYPEIFRELRARGDHFGLHVHPWRWDDGAGAWIADFADQGWVDHCVRSGIEAFQSALAEPCRSFRFGDGWINDATVELLDSLGVQFDLTIEMGLRELDLAEPFTGARPDYSDVPRHPYRPSMADFHRPGDFDRRNLWLIPISGGSVHSPMLPRDRRPAGESWVITGQQRARSGTLSARPNPIVVSARSETGITTVHWASEGTGEVEVRLHGPDGPLFTRGGPTGSKTTHEWVTNGTLFLLQDVSDGQGLTEADTLARLRVYTTPREETELTGDTTADEHMTLGLAFNSLLFARIMEALPRSLPYPYLAMVVRTDAPIRPQLRFNLEQSLDFIANHPRVESFAFETPEAMIQRIETRRKAQE